MIKQFKKFRFSLTTKIAVLLVAGSAFASGSPTDIIDTISHKYSGFATNQLFPFEAEKGVTTRGNYMLPYSMNGEAVVKSFWAQVSHNDTRATRGAEAQPVDFQLHGDGWFAFRFFLPSDFPADKELAIGQIFSRGGCKSWSALVIIRNNNLVISRRSSNGCTPEVDQIIASNLKRNEWNKIIIRFKPSNSRSGELKVWLNNENESNPNLDAKRINFGAGQFVMDSLDPNVPNNWINLKFGQYNYDFANYTPGETRTIYFDDVSMLKGNPTDAFNLVKPK